MKINAVWNDVAKLVMGVIAKQWKDIIGIHVLSIMQQANGNDEFARREYVKMITHHIVGDHSTCIHSNYTSVC